ncbi:PAS domain-containing protein [Candidatus Fukatsuia symbiotica]|uniref:Transcriptional regulator n=1 Tax=Candidatus Fukatsuia symbiotica TaxID=1878942 RepID=A0A2U8I664_9GAMM|nr:PAS domain-containing protein [Candidatus Fukatsuia symbiotica]AWK13344.1 transcriptional regulator [Candidatus Fukatsuia symbiotica]MEA9444225.1 PAS domain-containing protein [Candidatus Fukatsuia symbiotica]
MAKTHQENDPVKNTTPQISPQILSLCHSSTDPWGIKDLDSRYLYGNSAYFELLNLPARFDIEGLLDDEIPHPIHQFANDFREQDRQVQQSLKNISALDIHPYGRRKECQPYVFDKYPFYDQNGNCVGTIFHAKKLRFYSPMSCVQGKLPSSLLLSPPSGLFTRKELDVVFYTLQSFSAKRIAKKLNLAHRTIENRLQDIYRKSDVNSSSAFKDFCQAKGFDKYVPVRLLSPSSSIISDVVDYDCGEKE